MSWTLKANDTAGSASGTSVTANNGGSGYDTSGADLIVVVTSEFGFGGYTDGSVTDSKGNTYSKLTIYSSPHELMQMFYTWGSGITVGSGHTITFTTGNGDTGPALAFQAWSGSLVASDPLDASNGNSNYDPGSPFNSLSTNSVTPAASTDLAVTGINVRDLTMSQLAISGYTISDRRDNTGGNDIAMAYKVLSSSSTETPTWTWTDTKTEAAASIAVFKAAAAGIAFDAVANSGDQAAASSYSGSASWSGTNRMLAIDVSMLGPGVSVTAMTYGGANCTFIGSKSTVTSLGSVEQWRICSSDAGAPGTGANTLAVTLSSSIEFAVEWVSYTGVHQTSPTEAFNSNQATNTGSATDASVVVTTASDNCWIHAAVVANDTSITANQTSRNNISGTLGSGANEDNNTAVTPAGATTMSYTGLGTTATWAIAGYAIRPIADAALVTAVKRFLTLLGVS